jgi:hypothetical protein
MGPTPFHRLALVVLPPLFLTVYLLASFPRPPTVPIIHASLAHLPSSSPSWDVYPEDFYSGGAYANLPLGRARTLPICTRVQMLTQYLTQVRYWLIGPEDGRRVRILVRSNITYLSRLLDCSDTWTFDSGHRLERHSACTRLTRIPCTSVWCVVVF